MEMETENQVGFEAELSHALMYAQRTSVDRVTDARLVYFAAGRIDRRQGQKRQKKRGKGRI